MTIRALNARAHARVITDNVMRHGLSPGLDLDCAFAATSHQVAAPVALFW